MSLLVLSVSILGSRAVGLGKSTGWFTYIYIYMYNMHIIYIYIYTCVYIHIYIYIYIWSYIHTNCDKQTNKHTYIHIHAYICISMHTYVHPCMHACIHTDMLHTHTCTDIPCIAMPLGDQLLFMLSALHTQVADKRIYGWISGLRLSVMN